MAAGRRDADGPHRWARVVSSETRAPCHACRAAACCASAERQAHATTLGAPSAAPAGTPPPAPPRSRAPLTRLCPRPSTSTARRRLGEGRGLGPQLRPPHVHAGVRRPGRQGLCVDGAAGGCVPAMPDCGLRACLRRCRWLRGAACSAARSAATVAVGQTACHLCCLCLDGLAWFFTARHPAPLPYPVHTHARRLGAAPAPRLWRARLAGLLVC